MGGNYESPRQKYVKSIEGKTNWNMLQGKPNYVPAGNVSKGGFPGIGQMVDDLWKYFFGNRNEVSWRKR